ncbi:hypothetical protein ElyMa_001830800 [Elysia marginata]|uniref:LEM domain-containing protein n=1 Tax=Elysia marginata TaxID=1093978 RepID=A0AAV4EJU8_9GAST|nr:hypothetical protein ElyMa_001830800 [Elysia marginata]
MSFSPVPGAGTLVRVEEVRQRLNQCGLQGEKVTRKTARKYVPPTATASRTVADMARRLGSVGPEGREPHAKGVYKGEEKLVTGEVYSTFSIHTRNIHKRFNWQASTNGEDDTTTPTTSTTEPASSMPQDVCQSSSFVNREIRSRNSSISHELSPIMLKIASAPTPHKYPTNCVINPAPISCVAPNNASLSNGSGSSTSQTQHDAVRPSPKEKCTAKAKIVMDGESNHIKDSDKSPQISADKVSDSKMKDASPQNEENKSFGLKNVNLFSKFKISPFLNKKSPTEEKLTAVNVSGTLATKETVPKQTLKSTGTTASKSGPCNTKISLDNTHLKPVPNGNICDLKPTEQPAPSDKKITQTKHALSGGRINIQELINSPKVLKKETGGAKNKPNSPKHGTFRKCNSLADNATINTSPNQLILGTNKVNGIKPQPNIPQLNNIKNNTHNISDNNSIVGAKDNKNVDNKVKSICDKAADKASDKEDNASVVSPVKEQHDTNDVSEDADGEASKSNATEEPMDYTGVVFYKAK